MPRKAQAPSQGYNKAPRRSGEDFLDHDDDAAEAMSQQEALEALSLQGLPRRTASDEYFRYD